jgi:hypothetical protein
MKDLNRSRIRLAGSRFAPCRPAARQPFRVAVSRRLGTAKKRDTRRDAGCRGVLASQPNKNIRYVNKRILS